MKMPVLFVGHGSPMNAIERNQFTETLTGLSNHLPRPKAVCVVSAHWVTRGSEVLTVAKPRTIHDFYGFPAPLYEVEYPAPGAPTEAERVARELEIKPDETWGFDHGAWSVLRHLYPEADVPVFQVSLDAGRSLPRHVELGSRTCRAARPRRADSRQRQHRAQSAPFGRREGRPAFSLDRRIRLAGKESDRNSRCRVACRARALGQATGVARASHAGTLRAAPLLPGKHHRARRGELSL